MQYKTIVLELLEQRPAFHEQLRQQRTLLSTLEQYAQELKASHTAWQNLVAQTKPASAPSQIASEALELALRDLENRLPSALPPEDDESLSLEEAMASLRRHTPPA